MQDIPALFSAALQQYQVGLLPQAEQVCAQILRRDPYHVGTLFLLGLLDRQAGRSDQAVERLSQAVTLKPDFVEAHNSLGNALRDRNRLPEAVASYNAALRLSPDNVEVHNNLGVGLMDLGKKAEAVAHLQRAIQLNPNHAEACNNLGIALTGLGRLQEATTVLNRALQLRPNYIQAHNNIGVARMKLGLLQEAAASLRQAIALHPGYADAHINLGNVLIELGRPGEGEVSLRHALQLQPGSAEGHFNLGNALREQGKIAEAVESFRQAIRLKPHYAEAHNNLGNALTELGRPDEAVVSLQEALHLTPDHVEAHSNLGAAQMHDGKLDAAAASFQDAVRLNPQAADAHKNLGMTLLLLGKLEAGWAEYEWRMRCKEFAPKPFKQSAWDGASLAGKTILLYAEQGLGDALQFLRYAPLVKKLGCTVIFECPPALLPIVRSCAGIDRLVPANAASPDFDVHASLMSLPGILRTSLDNVPADVPYLSADPSLCERWQREMSGDRSFKIGIAWQGSPKYKGDKLRSIPLRFFAALAQVPGVHLYSLQKGPGSEQVSALAGAFPVIDLGSRLDEESGAFMDTAAVMKSLDLIVSSDTAIAHLAGALGAPVWTALPALPDWRWLLDREDSPWYPTMRLFRQTERGEWARVFERMANEVKKLMSQTVAPQHKKSTSVRVPISPGELLDKITILEIKDARLTDPTKLKNVRTELAELRGVCGQAVPASAQLDSLSGELRTVNEALWDVEDEIRLCERNCDFGPRFIELARSVYHKNDLRAAIKRKINDLLGADIVEEKSYAKYA